MHKLQSTSHGNYCSYPHGS